MRVYQLGRANTVEIYRTDSSTTVSSVVIYDAVSGATLATIASGSITNDSVNATLSATTVGDTTITASGLSAGIRYQIVETGLPSTEITTISKTASTATIREPLSIAYSASAKVKGLRATCTYTPAASGTGREVNVTWTLSNGEVYSDNALLVEYIVQCPVRSTDITTRYPRVAYHEPEWQRRAAVGWQPQIDEAWEQIRADLYAAGIRLETVRNIQALRELLISRVGLVMIDSGLDPLGYQDTQEARRQLLDNVTRELDRVLALGLNVDSRETGTENVVQKRVSLGWERWSDNTVRRQ